MATVDKTKEAAFQKEIEKLIHELTLEEKIGMIHGAELFRTKAVERLGIPALTMSDGPAGVRAEFQPKEWMLVGNTDDYVTYLPCISAVAATWNPERAMDAGDVLGREARGRGKDIILAPGVNLKRTPLNGRNFEYFSEDPRLTVDLAAPFVKGVQKSDVAACVKHYALNHQETARLEVDAEIDEEVLRNLYLKVYEEIIEKAMPLSMMSAYNKIYGTYCSEHPLLLDQILRKEWGYDGLVVSDWGAVRSTDAVRHGNDVEMSVTYNFDDYHFAKPLKEKVEKGEVDIRFIDEKVAHILLLMYRLRMIGEEKDKRKSGSYNTAENRAKALDIARESIVLLKNEKKTLPLSKDALRGKRVLLVGENANRIHSNGGGSAEIKALYELSPLMGIKSLLGGNTKVEYLPGYISKLDASMTPEGTNWQAISLENAGGQTEAQTKANQLLEEKRAALREEVLSVCEQYDQIIFVGGLNHDMDSEGLDRKDIDLPYEQNELLVKLLEKRKDTVVVMLGGGCVDMTKWLSHCDSLVWMYYNGMEGGRALAETLFGEVNPSGHLPETFYCKKEDCSGVSVGDCGDPDMVHYKEGMEIGYRYTEKHQIPVQFPFGYGLSYSEFELQAASMENGKLDATVANLSDREGMAVLQVYRLADDELTYPELVAFQKVEVPAKGKINTQICVTNYDSKKTYGIGFHVGDYKMI